MCALFLTFHVVVIIPVVSESTASNGVDNDQEHQEHHIHYSNLFPVIFNARQDPGLARIAVVAKHRLIVTPFLAIRVVRAAGADFSAPECRINVLQVTCRRWLATSRL